MKPISIVALTLIMIGTVLAFTRRTQEPTKIMDYPAVFGGREPIKIANLGGWTFEVKNVSGQSITRFTLHFIAAQSGGVPLHGDGAHQHVIPIKWGQDNNQILRPGGTAQISIEQSIKLAAKNPDFDLDNTEISAFEAHFESGKKWFAGKFYKPGAAAGTWQEEVGLNPVQPRIIGGPCYEYRPTETWPQPFCNTLSCPQCTYDKPLFATVTAGGYPKIKVCASCVDFVGGVCQKPNGSACTQPNVEYLDFRNPC